MPPKQRNIAVMGYRSVGKSSLTLQFVDGKFVETYDPTIENTFTKNTKIRGQEYYIKLIDTAGQDDYSIFPRQYAIDIHACCIVFAVNSTKSFEVAKLLHEKLLDCIGNPNFPVLLVGNKTDLKDERVIQPDEGQQLAASMNAEYVEVTAKNNNAVSSSTLFGFVRLLLIIRIINR